MSGVMFGFTFDGEPFRGIRPGDIVEYMANAGMGLAGPEYKKARGRCVMTFPDHVTLNVGGKYGTPAVVDKTNFVRIARRKR